MQDLREIHKLNTNTIRTEFITSAGKNFREMELIALLSAWISNRECVWEDISIQNIILRDMEGQPRSFIFSKKWEQWNDDMRVVCGILTRKHLSMLCSKIYDSLTQYDTIESAYNAVMRAAPARDKCRYGHEALAVLFSGGTCLPTKTSNATFYRYNLFLYWMKSKLRLWSRRDMSRLLLPCNDALLDRAVELGVTKKRLSSNLYGAHTLTDIARDTFGETDIYKMYEILDFYDAR